MSNTERGAPSFPLRLKKVFSVPPNDRTESDLSELIHATSDIEYLKRLTEERGSDRVHWECCRVMTLEIFQKDQNVITLGEIGEKFYIILQGKVSILLPIKVRKPPKLQKIQNFKRLGTFIDAPHEKNFPILRKSTISDFDFDENLETQEMIEAKVLSSGDSFGELALLNNESRSATVKCLEQCYLAVIVQRDYKKILRSDAEKTVKERVEILKHLPIFNEVSESSLKCLGYLLTEATYKKGQIVYLENSEIQNIYFVKSGEFKQSIRDTVSKPKNFSSGSLLKLKMMRTSTKSIDLSVVIKGKYQIFGYEEFVLAQDSRTSTCTCISLYGKVFVASLNDLKIRPGCSEILKCFKNLHNSEKIKSTDRLESIRTVQRLKQNYGKRLEGSLDSLSSQNIHNVLHEMGKRHRPAFLVNEAKLEVDSFSPRKSESKRNETEGSVKSLSLAKCPEMTPRIVTRTKEIVKNHGEFLRNVLKKSGIGGVFRESYNDIYQLAGTCRTSKSKAEPFFM